MKTSATNRRLRLLLTAISDNSLIPQPDFQRRLVWTNKDKVAFIDTVLKGYPFPEIYIAAGSVDPDSGKGTEFLVDGQQRITTLYQYFKGSKDLRLPKAFGNYAALTDAKKVEFLEYEVVVRDLGNIELDAIKNIFTRINSTNYSLNAMEIHNARFDGELKQFAEALAENSFFEKHATFSAAEIRRMQDVRYVLSLLITMLSTYFNRDAELEAYLDRYNEDFSAGPDLQKQAEQLFTTIDKFEFPETSRAWKKVDLFSLVIELHRAIFKRKIAIDTGKAKQRLNAFYNQVDQVGEPVEGDALFAKYHRAAFQATNDRGNRIVRGEIVQNLLDPQYKPQFPEYSPG